MYFWPLNCFFTKVEDSPSICSHWRKYMLFWTWKTILISFRWLTASHSEASGVCAFLVAILILLHSIQTLWGLTSYSLFSVGFMSLCFLIVPLYSFVQCMVFSHFNLLAFPLLCFESFSYWLLLENNGTYKMILFRVYWLYNNKSLSEQLNFISVTL